MLSELKASVLTSVRWPLSVSREVFVPVGLFSLVLSVYVSTVLFCRRRATFISPLGTIRQSIDLQMKKTLLLLLYNTYKVQLCLHLGVLSDLILEDAFMFASFWISSLNFLSTTGLGTSSSSSSWELQNITVNTKCYSLIIGNVLGRTEEELSDSFTFQSHILCFFLGFL